MSLIGSKEQHRLPEINLKTNCEHDVSLSVQPTKAVPYPSYKHTHLISRRKETSWRSAEDIQ